MLEKIERFFKLSLYTKSQLHKFVDKGIITKEQYEKIVEGA